MFQFSFTNNTDLKEEGRPFLELAWPLATECGSTMSEEEDDNPNEVRTFCESCKRTHFQPQTQEKCSIEFYLQGPFFSTGWKTTFHFFFHPVLFWCLQKFFHKKV